MAMAQKPGTIVKTPTQLGWMFSPRTLILIGSFDPPYMVNVWKSCETPKNRTYLRDLTKVILFSGSTSCHESSSSSQLEPQVISNPNEFEWIRMNSNEFEWIRTNSNGFERIRMDSKEFYDCDMAVAQSWSPRILPSCRQTKDRAIVLRVHVPWESLDISGSSGTGPSTSHACAHMRRLERTKKIKTPVQKPGLAPPPHSNAEVFITMSKQTR